MKKSVNNTNVEIKLARLYYSCNMLDEAIIWMKKSIEGGNMWARLELIDLLRNSNNISLIKESYDAAQEIASNRNDPHQEEAIKRIGFIHSQLMELEQSDS